MTVNENKKPNAELLGKALAKARKQKGMTQEQLAARLCVSAKAVSKWECCRGIPDISLYESICEVLNINVYDFCVEEAAEISDDAEGSGVGEKAIKHVFGKRRFISIMSVVAVAAMLCVAGLTYMLVTLLQPSVDLPSQPCDISGQGEFLFEAEKATLSEELIVYNDAGSGSGYVGNFDYHNGAEMSFTFTSAGDYNAQLSFCLVTRGIDDLCNETYTVTFNGQEIYSRTVFRGRSYSLTDFSEYFIAPVAFTEGKNTLNIIFNSNSDNNNGHNFDYVKFNTRPSKENSDIVLEAEESAHTEELRTYYDAGSGLGYLGYFDQTDGAEMVFDFEAGAGGQMAMFFCLNPRGNYDKITDTYTVTLNGEEVLSDSIIYGSWNNDWMDFKEQFVSVVNLKEGANVLKIQYHAKSYPSSAVGSNNGHNFDYVKFTEVEPFELDVEGETVAEAESCVFDSSRLIVMCEDSVRYLGNFDNYDGAELRFVIHSEEAVNTLLKICLSPRGLNEKITDSYDIYVNGREVTSDGFIVGGFTSWTDFKEYEVGKVELSAGYNEVLIIFKANDNHSNGHNFDYISLTTVKIKDDALNNAK